MIIVKTVQKVVAGNLKNFYHNWERLTSDRWVLNTVLGISIDFDELPCQEFVPRPYKLTVSEIEFVNEEINSLLHKNVLQEVQHVSGEWISNIFLRPKPNGKFRMILDLTELNKKIHYEHFKMFSLNTAIDSLDVNMWMASVDLKDAYYTINIPYITV